jgi:aminoacyl tRNA synthase complex-interacting multifunctional protein 1
MAAIDAAIAKLNELIAGGGGGGAAAAPAPLPAAATRAAPTAAAAAPAAAAATAATSPAPAAPAASTAPSVPGQADPGGRETIETKANLKVARVLAAEPLPGSDKLLRLRVDAGPNDERQIMAGLQQYLEPEDLVGRLLVIVANLKPAKLAGELSQGMVLAADGTDAASGARIVRTLVPPPGAAPGDDVVVEGCAPPAPVPPGASKRQTEAAMMKKEAWWASAAGLVVRGRAATFEGRPLVCHAGDAAGQAVGVAPEIADGGAIS